MKITFFSADPGNHRFIQPIIDALALSGHECQLMNNWTITDADVYWFDFVDNNLIVASKENKELLKSKKVIARLHAVEAYMGFYRQVDWTCVTDLIYVSEHLKEKCSDVVYPDNCKIHVIHNGVDLDRFSFAIRNNETHNFGYVGNIVPQKGLLTFLHYFSEVKRTLKDAKFYLAGLSRMHGREGEYWEHLKKTIGDVYEEGPTEDTNKWLDDKKINWLVQPSYAESFSLIIGEAMAKGIKPLINDFWGSRGLWPEDLIYKNFREFAVIMVKKYESQTYRDWVGKRYSLKEQIKKVEEILKK